MLATLTVALIVAMCATPLVLLAREIIDLTRHQVRGHRAAAEAVPATAPVEYIASRPILPLG
jgi:hypothetical protein